MKNFEYLELLANNNGGTSGASVDPIGQGNVEAVPGRTAEAVTSQAELERRMRDSTAQGNVDARVRALMEQVLLLTDNIKKNTDAERTLELMPAQMGVMIKMIGKILDGLGMENGLVEFVDNDPFFQFNGPQPDLGSLSGFTGTVQNALENRTVRGDISQGTSVAIGTERRVPAVVNESNISVSGGETAAPVAASPADTARSTGSVARSVIDQRSTEAGLDVAAIRSIDTAFRSADANHNGALEAGEQATFRTSLSTPAKNALDQLFAPATP